ncbi:hypothetical protein OSB04_024985 [Centaurea solstitialis]|uniref:Uncharacterized protein n=1 Tax=Centaurea solstitialis TaxID=347529 RepID=A0AA38SMU4_9ASTR|nr:hypothetical protein OSB04_024985 [Centaurea solstitialis]
MKPFKLFNVYMDKPDFEVVKRVWEKKLSSDPNKIFRDRLKNVKSEIKLWTNYKACQLEVEAEIMSLKKDECKSASSLWIDFEIKMSNMQHEK